MVRAYNQKIAMWLFAIYLILYVGFILINVLTPEIMERTPLAGVNLAIWYGFGLIAAAIFLAFLYGFLCRPASLDDEPKQEAKQGGNS